MLASAGIVSQFEVCNRHGCHSGGLGYGLGYTPGNGRSY